MCVCANEAKNIINVRPFPSSRYTVEYFSADLQTGWVVAVHRVLTQTITVSKIGTMAISCQYLTDKIYNKTITSKQISELKPATSYVFLVRAENTYGLSVPSALSTVIRTHGSDRGYVPQSELSSARLVLSGKVSK